MSSRKVPFIRALNPQLCLWQSNEHHGSNLHTFCVEYCPKRTLWRGGEQLKMLIYGLLQWVVTSSMARAASESAHRCQLSSTYGSTGWHVRRPRADVLHVVQASWCTYVEVSNASQHTHFTVTVSESHWMWITSGTKLPAIGDELFLTQKWKSL